MKTMLRKTLSRSQLIVLLHIIPVVSLTFGSSIYLASMSARTAPTRAIVRSWPFEFSISIDKTSYEQSPYNEVLINLTLRNISNSAVWAFWSSYTLGKNPFDILIIDSNGTTIYQLTRYLFRYGSTFEITLKPNDRHDCFHTWKQYWIIGANSPVLVQKGTHYIKASTYGPQLVKIDGVEQQITQLETPPLSFTIK